MPKRSSSLSFGLIMAVASLMGLACRCTDELAIDVKSDFFSFPLNRKALLLSRGYEACALKVPPFSGAWHGYQHEESRCCWTGCWRRAEHSRLCHSHGARCSNDGGGECLQARPW